MLERVTEGRHTAEHILSETDPLLCRDEVTFASGAAIVPGQVVAKVLVGALSAVGAAGLPAPAGATISAAPAVAAGSKVGVYSAICETAGATGTWQFFDPDGIYLGTVVTGTPATFGGVGPFTITDTGTDPAIGEVFKITVAAAEGSGKFKPLDPDAHDGTEIAAAIAYAAVDSADADARGVVSARETVVKAPVLAWPEGISGPQKAAAIANLADAHIIIR